MLYSNKIVVLVIGCLLLLLGLFRPNFSNFFPLVDQPRTVINVIEPTESILKEACSEVSKILQKGNSSDALRLSSLYSDIGDLIALDGENEVVKNTEEIRQTNKLSGLLLRLDIKGKYEGLAKASEKVIVISLGSDDVVLDKDLRDKAVTSFKVLAWACKEGSK